MHLGASKSHFIRIGYARFKRPIEDVQKFRVITKQQLQGLSQRAMATCTEEILRRGVDVFDKQAVIEDDDGRVQMLEQIAALGWISAAPDLLFGVSFAA